MVRLFSPMRRFSQWQSPSCPLPSTVLHLITLVDEVSIIWRYAYKDGAWRKSCIIANSLTHSRVTKWVNKSCMIFNLKYFIFKKVSGSMRRSCENWNIKFQYHVWMPWERDIMIVVKAFLMNTQASKSSRTCWTTPSWATLKGRYDETVTEEIFDNHWVQSSPA